MKKYLALFLAALCCCTLCITSAAASDVDEVIISTTRIDLPDGGYIIEEVTQTPTLARATSYSSGAKTSTRYTESGHALYAVKVTGSFGYNGSSSWATGSSATVSIYDSGVTYVSKNAWYSGNTAYASGTIKYLGITESRTVSISCDKNGNLY